MFPRIACTFFAFAALFIAVRAEPPADHPFEKEIAAYEVADKTNPPPQGAIVFTGGKGGGSSFLERKSPLEGKATVADGRIRGAVKLIKTGDFGKAVTLNFDVPIDEEVKGPRLERWRRCKTFRGQKSRGRRR